VFETPLPSLQFLFSVLICLTVAADEQVMDHRDGEVKVRYVRTASETSQPGTSRNHIDSLARQTSFTCVNGDNVIIVTDDADDVDGRLASWTCTRCSTSNPVSVAQCISCLAFQVPSSQSVKDTNSSKEKSSGAEYGSGDGEVEAMTVDDELWVCRRCTLHNEAESIRCQLCEAPRRSTSFHNGTVDSVSDKCQHSTNADSKVDVHGMGDDKMTVSSPSFSVDRLNNVATRCGDNRIADWAVWTCKSCTYNNNPSWASICDVCETVKGACGSPQLQGRIEKTVSNTTVRENIDEVASIWQCRKCTTVNANSVRDCISCGALRMMVQTECSQDMWTCSKCTLQNNSVAHVCAACLSKRNTDLPRIDNSNTKWSCSKCTCINHGDRHSCQACGHYKQTSHNHYNSSHGICSESESSSMRQRSIHVKEQQIKEEMAARDQWMQIVNYCKVVSVLFVYRIYVYSYHIALVNIHCSLSFDTQSLFRCRNASIASFNCLYL